jgi:hypothetical protein
MSVKLQAPNVTAHLLVDLQHSLGRLGAVTGEQVPGRHEGSEHGRYQNFQRGGTSPDLLPRWAAQPAAAAANFGGKHAKGLQHGWGWKRALELDKLLGWAVAQMLACFPERFLCVNHLRAALNCLKVPGWE